MNCPNGHRWGGRQLNSDNSTTASRDEESANDTLVEVQLSPLQRISQPRKIKKSRKKAARLKQEDFGDDVEKLK